MTQLDITGPAEVLSKTPGAKIHMIWKDLSPVGADAGVSTNPTTAFNACPDLDAICIYGGLGIVPFLDHEDLLQFLRCQADVT